MIRKRIVRFIFVRGMLYAAANELQRRQKVKRAQTLSCEEADLEKAAEHQSNVIEAVRARNQKKVLAESKDDQRMLHLLEYELGKSERRVADLLLPLSEKLDRLQEQMDALQETQPRRVFLF